MNRLIAASLMLAAGTLGTLAAPAAAGAHGDVVSYPVAQNPEAVVHYWTPERLQSAVPFGDTTSAGPAARSAVAPPPDQETSPAADTLYPQRVHGKLFLRKGTSNRVCSATLVTASANAVILTAAHCLFDRGLGVEATNVAFAPGFRDRAMPFGLFPATALHYPREFTQGAREFDIGAVNLGPNASGASATVLGTRGVSFNKPRRSYRGDVFQIFGYPGEPTDFYDAQRLILCVSPFAGFNHDGALLADPCYQHEGSSGGAWLGADGLITSVSSRHPSCPTTANCTTVKIGTYLGDVAFQVWAAAAGGVPKGVKKRLKRCKPIRKKPKKERCRHRAETFGPIVA